MSNIVVVEYISLDGVIQAPGDPNEDPEGFLHGGWTRPYFADHGVYMRDLYATAGAFLLGRLTYQIFAAYWPSVTDEGDPIAHALNTRPKYVASTTLREARWRGTTVIGGDIAAAVTALKEGSGSSILVIGSAALAQTLMRHDLVDEYRLMVHPIILGCGKRLFTEGTPATTLKLVEVRRFDSGVVAVAYQQERRA